MFDLREVVKMAIEMLVEGNNLKLSDEGMRRLIEEVAYAHARKYNYPYFNQGGRC